MIADPESGPPSSAHTHYKWDQGHLGLFFKASTSDRVKMQKKKQPRRWKTGQKWRMGKNLGGDRVVNGNGNLLEWHLGTGIWEDGK